MNQTFSAEYRNSLPNINYPRRRVVGVFPAGLGETPELWAAAGELASAFLFSFGGTAVFFAGLFQ